MSCDPTAFTGIARRGFFMVTGAYRLEAVPLMTFKSILFNTDGEGANELSSAAPSFFVDLNLNQVIDAITAERDMYNLQPFFFTPLHSEDAIQYRHEIMQEIKNENLMAAVKSFAGNMVVIRRYLALSEKLIYKNFKEGWFLEAAVLYCETVNSLVRDLSVIELKSRGFLAFRDYLKTYTGSDAFSSLVIDTKKLSSEFSGVKYSLHIHGLTVRVRKYEGETDFSVEVAQTFEKFKQGTVKDYRTKLRDGTDINDVEARILDFVAKLYPAIFAGLDNFYEQHSQFVNETISLFDREIQFYVAYLEFIAKFQPAGLNFCYPQISSVSKEVNDSEGFDLALANKLISEGSSVVCNSFYLKDRERIFVVSGPNQGGKTTFARMFGQVHYLAGLGCPVPGKEARLFLCDNLFTHFEKMEDIKDLRGKLQDDLVRMHEILAQATPNSIIIINEILTSTTLQDAIFLSKKVIEKIIGLDLLCVWVTFVEELSTYNEKTVSMVSTVNPENPALSIFKVIRKRADGLSYAHAIAEKHHLTYKSLQERIKS
jgi:DNA mismatch repair protein MutS